ncbi:hypothetical protein BB560_002733 [Smittium megazygosporum]|uniref:G-protein coupled receptors family 1 profile domain-containing protein n=1 Tax=Smittium megazygosporum TaxID=133381 RepID=A0A2T9ZE26_9FUNG|nr:hypothetical protein BB560_002733 [Smittium megazygosporum]
MIIHNLKNNLLLRRQNYDPPSQSFMVLMQVFYMGSVLSGLAVVIIIAFTKFKKRAKLPLAFRVSFYIAVFDILGYGIRFGLNTLHSPPLISGTVSRILQYLIMVSMISGISLSDAIALSLHLNVLLKNPFKKRSNWYYEYVAIAVALIIPTTIFFLYDFVRYSPEYNSFFILKSVNDADESATILCMSLTYYLPMFIGLFYCLVVFIHVSIFSFLPLVVKSNPFSTRNMLDSNIHVTVEQKQKALSTIRWLVLYPLVPIISCSLFVVTGFFINKVSLYQLSTIFTASQGVLNLLVFTMSPKFRTVQKLQSSNLHIHIHLHIFDFSTIFNSTFNSVAVSSASIPDSDIKLNASELSKRQYSNYGRGGDNRGDRDWDRNGRGRGNGKRRGYYRYGRYWFWDQNCDNQFLTTLRYRPRNYYSQKFQYLYLYTESFRNSWNSDTRFRSRWESDDSFRQVWFTRIQYTGWAQIDCDSGSQCGSINTGNSYC